MMLLVVLVDDMHWAPLAGQQGMPVTAETPCLLRKPLASQAETVLSAPAYLHVWRCLLLLLHQPIHSRLAPLPDG